MGKDLPSASAHQNMHLLRRSFVNSIIHIASNNDKFIQGQNGMAFIKGIAPQNRNNSQNSKNLSYKDDQFVPLHSIRCSNGMSAVQRINHFQFPQTHSRATSQFSCEKENELTVNLPKKQPNLKKILQPQQQPLIQDNFCHSRALNYLGTFPSPINAEQNISPIEAIVVDPVSSTQLYPVHLQYTPEIIEHLLKTESKFSAKGCYIGVVQKEVNERMRGILLDWLVEVHLKFKLQIETLFMTVNLIDRYLEKVEIGSFHLQLLGITSLFVASKYEEVYRVPHVKDLVHVCDNAYTKEQIFEMESLILSKLSFNILSVSSFRMLDFFVEYEPDLESKNYFFARYLIEIALLEYKLISYPTSLIAAASIYLVNKIRKRPISWNSKLEQVSGYSEGSIRPCAKQICHLIQTIDQRKYLTSLKKKFSKPQFQEVAKIKIEQNKEASSCSYRNYAQSKPALSIPIQITLEDNSNRYKYSSKSPLNHNKQQTKGKFLPLRIDQEQGDLCHNQNESPSNIQNYQHSQQEHCGNYQSNSQRHFSYVVVPSVPTEKENNNYTPYYYNFMTDNYSSNSIPTSNNINPNYSSRPLNFVANQLPLPHLPNHISSNSTYTLGNNYEDQPAVAFPIMNNYHSNNNISKQENMNNDLQQQDENEEPKQNSQSQDQILEQTEWIEVSVSAGAARTLIEKRINELSDQINSSVYSMIAHKLYEESLKTVELTVPCKMIVQILENKIESVSAKQLWQLPVTLAKIVTNAIFQQDQIEYLNLIPSEFIDELIHSLLSSSSF